MLFGSTVEFVAPVGVALVAVGLWFAAPRLRRNNLLRLGLILAVAISAIEVMAFVVLFGVFALSGGMDAF